MVKEDQALQGVAQRALTKPDRQWAVQEIVWRLIKNHRLDQHFELSGSKYAAGVKGVRVDLQGKTVRTQGTIVAGDDLLQRVAAGQAGQVAKEIEREIGKVATARGVID